MPKSPSEIWAEIKDEIVNTGDLDRVEDMAIAAIASGVISDVIPLAQVEDPQINFTTDKKADGTPRLVAISASLRKPEEGMARLTPDRALIVRYKDGSVNISSAKVPT